MDNGVNIVILIALRRGQSRRRKDKQVPIEAIGA